METEDQLSARYEAELAAIAALDRRYYSNSCPSCCERADYAARQDKLQALRAGFYAEVALLRLNKSRLPPRCRFLPRRSRLRAGRANSE
jgi:hypothetical protein